jgi:hypothetical protein
MNPFRQILTAMPCWPSAITNLLTMVLLCSACAGQGGQTEVGTEKPGAQEAGTEQARHGDEAAPDKLGRLRRRVREAIASYGETVEKSEAALDGALDEAIGKIGRSLPLERKAAERDGLRRQVAAFRTYGVLPSHPPLGRVAGTHRHDIGKAAAACYRAHRRLADELSRRDHVDEALRVLEEARRLLSQQRAWVAPVPPHVETNVAALRGHRPRYVRKLRAELDAVVRAAARGDAQLFQRAVDAAIAATIASETPSEKAGCPNCRDDILVVLQALRRGEWDLRQSRFHLRDHRKRRMRSGLGGMDYDG